MEDDQVFRSQYIELQPQQQRICEPRHSNFIIRLHRSSYELRHCFETIDHVNLLCRVQLLAVGKRSPRAGSRQRHTEYRRGLRFGPTALPLQVNGGGLQTRGDDVHYLAAPAALMPLRASRVNVIEASASTFADAQDSQQSYTRVPLYGIYVLEVKVEWSTSAVVIAPRRTEQHADASAAPASILNEKSTKRYHLHKRVRYSSRSELMQYDQFDYRDGCLKTHRECRRYVAVYFVCCACLRYRLASARYNPAGNETPVAEFGSND
ncbi:hypothetical protein EVAR_6615_1 [Eumeta japonica]|uniref:Uncharacterized protein n=1 Tax=Eumeta variegata TaxID=151549 RepID=A0A4C1TLM3_EUMVA|nr:hypothetical protein EVAR_6615_1 [Eumeta japonica]